MTTSPRTKSYMQAKRERREGERYRLDLARLARELGVREQVLFHDRFVSSRELKSFLAAADVFVTPYPNLEQICSGTLAYALGAGNAVVSTPYWHARELLAAGRGILVPPGDPAAIAGAVSGLLDDPQRREAMRRRAYRYARQMTWDAVARRYLQTLALASGEILAPYSTREEVLR